MIYGSLADSNHTLPCWLRDIPCWLWIAISPTFDELSDAFDLYFPDNCGHIPKDKSILPKDNNILNENVLPSVYLARLRKDGRLGYIVIINGKQINKDVCVNAASIVWAYFKECLVCNQRDYSDFFIKSVTMKIREAWKEYKNTGK